jgi:hypothetical protein
MLQNDSEALRASHDEPLPFWESHLPRLQEKIKHSRGVLAYEGLPRPDRAGIYEQEKKTKRTMELHGFDFYVAPVILRGAPANQLTKLCLGDNLFYRYRAGKMCGPFHPDWCLVFDDVQILFCFSCAIARLYSPDESVFADLYYLPTERENYKLLGRMLTRYRKYCPLTIDAEIRERFFNNQPEPPTRWSQPRR